VEAFLRITLMHLLRGRASQRAAPLAIAVVLGGCGGGFAMGAEEFRSQMASSVERLEVNRSLREVGTTFRERAAACLQITTKSYSGPAGRYTMSVMAYSPSVVVTDTRVELHVQARYEGAITLHDQGQKGHYTFLAHATPLDARRTRLEIWGDTTWGQSLRNAVKGWASGSFAGCPDLS
jgi:hypothetical protein